MVDKLWSAFLTLALIALLANIVFLVLDVMFVLPF